ncbi:hypothetical protein [Halomonas sp. BMC6]|uniref:hypothetical protein n=1 Tax=Halomonas sp. BMC6 TaxID=3073244 RepID=UPI0030D1A208
MRIEINSSENVELVCNGKLIAEFSAGAVVDASYHEAEIKQARVALVLAKNMAKVTDWVAFVDGVNNVLREHSYSGGGVPGFVAPADPKARGEQITAYRDNWSIGEMVRKYISEDQLDLFGEVA